MKLRSANTFVVALIALPIISGCLVKSGGTGTSKDSTLKINAKSNVFAAGEGGLNPNGGGVAAPSVTIEPRAGLVLTFSSVAGRVSCCGDGEEFNDADGGTFAGGVTDVESAGGISGITHPNKTMFLVGVFTDNNAARPPGPERLNATDSKNTTPKLFQTFFIGNGKGKQIEVPPTATRLYLGFADAYNFTGAPGSYDDNVGELIATFSIRPR
ncbi:MAG TPA: hypothetical protein VNF70_03385 [Pyrinomonadaceae bacterium]|nr:hypothetical protein [Pyrinomonadaceae bacterium]